MCQRFQNSLEKGKDGADKRCDGEWVRRSEELFEEGEERGRRLGAMKVRVGWGKKRGGRFEGEG